ncbi:hypothetical protein [Plantactinospora veratri]
MGGGTAGRAAAGRHGHRAGEGEPQRWAAKQAAKQAARERAKIEKRARIEERKRRRDEQAGQGEPA